MDKYHTNSKVHFSTKKLINVAIQLLLMDNVFYRKTHST